MSDDYEYNENNTNNDDASFSASAIFAEIMRQAAARQTPPPVAESATEQPEGVDYEDPLPIDDAGDAMVDVADIPTLPDTPPIADSEQALIPQAIRSDTLRNREKLEKAMEQQRIQRVKRRRERRRRNTVGAIGGFIRTVFVVLISAGLVATILTWFTDPQFLNPTVVRGLQESNSALIAEFTPIPTIQPTLAVTPNWLQRIGIVAGHRGPENDPGAVCDDGLTEVAINFDVAQRVVRNLRDRNYSVDLLDEFDPRLDNYQAAALISIHSNTCQDFGEIVSGYMVAKAASRPDQGVDTILAECIAQNYEAIVPLERRFNLTLDMTDYHSFREIHPLTPAAIIELGFMLADRELLTQQPDLLAQAITNGVVCFLEPTESYPVLPTSVNANNNIPDNFVPVESLTPLPEAQG